MDTNSMDRAAPVSLVGFGGRGRAIYTIHFWRRWGRYACIFCENHGRWVTPFLLNAVFVKICVIYVTVLVLAYPFLSLSLSHTHTHPFIDPSLTLSFFLLGYLVFIYSLGLSDFAHRTRIWRQAGGYVHLIPSSILFIYSLLPPPQLCIFQICI